MLSFTQTEVHVEKSNDESKCWCLQNDKQEIIALLQTITFNYNNAESQRKFA